MGKRGWTAFVCACMLAGIIGCGKKDTEPVYSASQAAQDYEEPEQKVFLPKEALSAGINNFAFQMYDELGQQENVFFSPYSLCSALSLLDVGADSETKEELEELLGITDLDAWNREMKDYLEKQWTDDTFVITANAIWMDGEKEFAPNIEADFLKPAGYYYYCELFEADFRKNSADAIKQINGWTEKNTRGMIPEIVNTIPNNTVMTLLNAVYFEGKWETPFQKENSFEEIFHGTQEDSPVEMMHQYRENYAYVESGEIKGISLPYMGESVVMKVFLPTDEGGDIIALFSALSHDEREALLNSLDDAEAKKISRLSMPKFSMDRSMEGLVEILQDMGMQAAFREDADFDKIGLGLYVSQIVHKAKIEVDEEGSRAAAATAVMMNDSAAFIEEETIEFVLDKPFVFVLQDTETGIILFMGRVNNL